MHVHRSKILRLCLQLAIHLHRLNKKQTYLCSTTQVLENKVFVLQNSTDEITSVNP